MYIYIYTHTHTREEKKESSRKYMNFHLAQKL
jgi:hypothetical protein